MRVSFKACVAACVLATTVVVPIAKASEPEDRDPVHGSSAAAKNGRADEMAAWSVDAGGGQSTGGAFALTAAIGQPDAGVVSSGGTVLAGGLWAGTVDFGAIFVNGFESGGTGAWSSATGGTE